VTASLRSCTYRDSEQYSTVNSISVNQIDTFAFISGPSFVFPVIATSCCAACIFFLFSRFSRGKLSFVPSSMTHEDITTCQWPGPMPSQRGLFSSGDSARCSRLIGEQEAKEKTIIYTNRHICGPIKSHGSNLEVRRTTAAVCAGGVGRCSTAHSRLFLSEPDLLCCRQSNLNLLGNPV
jgi:hypothetical protein